MESRKSKYLVRRIESLQENRVKGNHGQNRQSRKKADVESYKSEWIFVAE